jgi:hypothetical protein
VADAATEITDAAGLSSCSYSALAAVTEMVSVLATTDVDAVPTTDVAQSSGSYLFFAAAVAAVSKCPQHCHLLPFCSNNIS